MMKQRFLPVGVILGVAVLMILAPVPVQKRAASVASAVTIPIAVPVGFTSSACEDTPESTLILNWFSAKFDYAVPERDVITSDYRYIYRPACNSSAASTSGLKNDGKLWVVYQFNHKNLGDTSYQQYITDDERIIGAVTNDYQNPVNIPSAYNSMALLDKKVELTSANQTGYDIKLTCKISNADNSQQICDFSIVDGNGITIATVGDVAIFRKDIYFQIFYPQYFGSSSFRPWTNRLFCNPVSLLNRCTEIPDQDEPAIPSLPLVPPKEDFSVTKRILSPTTNHNYDPGTTITYWFRVERKKSGGETIATIYDDIPKKADNTTPALEYIMNYVPVVGNPNFRYEKNNTGPTAYATASTSAVPETGTLNWTEMKLCDPTFTSFPTASPPYQTPLDPNKKVGPLPVVSSVGGIDVYEMPTSGTNNGCPAGVTDCKTMVAKVGETCVAYSNNGTTNRVIFFGLKIPGSSSGESMFVKASFKVK